MRGTEVHPFELVGVTAQVAKCDRSHDYVPINRDPECGVRRDGVAEIMVEHRIRLEAELAQGIHDERGKSFGVPGIERHDVDHEISLALIAHAPTRVG